MQVDGYTMVSRSRMHGETGFEAGRARTARNDEKSMGARLYGAQTMREQRFRPKMLVNQQKSSENEDKIEENLATATRSHKTTGPH